MKITKKDTKMLFQNLENLYLITILLIAHRLIKSYPWLLFPLTKIPFVRLIEDEKTKTKAEKKKKKELEKRLQQGQRVISYEKGILFGALENMTDINHIGDFLQVQYITLTAVGMMITKISSYVLYEVFDLKTKFIEKFLVNNNLLNILLAGCVGFFFSKLIRFKVMYGGLRGSESLSSFIFTGIFSVFLCLFIFSFSRFLILSVEQSLGLLNSSLQVIMAMLSKNPRHHFFLEITQTHFNLLLLALSLVTTWILASPILKFGKIYNTVNSAIIVDEEKLETLEGDRESNQETIEKVQGILKGNKKRIRYLLLSLTLDILILLLYIKPILKDLFDSEFIQKYHSLLVFSSAMLSILLKIYSSKIELQIKYTSLFQKLINFRPKDELYHDIYKQQIDLVYKDSLRDSFIIFSKVLLPLFVLFLGISLAVRERVYRGNQEQIVKGILKQSTQFEVFSTEILASGAEVFGQLGSKGMCPLRIEDRLVKIEQGFGVTQGADLNEKLINGEFGDYIGLVILNGNLVLVEFLKFYVFLIYFVQFFGSVFYIFYVMKTEEFY